jgi:hypothetical protein
MAGHAKGSILTAKFLAYVKVVDEIIGREISNVPVTHHGMG